MTTREDLLAHLWKEVININLRDSLQARSHWSPKNSTHNARSIGVTMWILVP